MVWMVETQVNGEKVLAPIVYLSAATKSMFDKGDATIAANEANMNLTSLTNTGGTIEGSDTLSITSQSDITNTSGMIKGGDVRSEEHTSELQSLMRISYAVFCLKKKKNK